MTRTLLISIGAVAGANARYWVGVLFAHLAPSAFPWATLAINASGSFLLGAFFAVESARLAGGTGPRLLIAVGFCGAYTTFSTFSFEVLALVQQRAFLLAGGYIAASLLLGVAAVAGGYLAGSLAGNA